MAESAELPVQSEYVGLTKRMEVFGGLSVMESGALSPVDDQAGLLNVRIGLEHT